MEILTEAQECVWDHKGEVLHGPGFLDPRKLGQRDENQDRWLSWWHRRFEGVSTRKLRRNAHLNLFPQQFAALWAEPEFWRLIRQDATLEELASFINEQFLPVSASGVHRAVANACKFLNQKQAQGSGSAREIQISTAALLKTVNDQQARTALITQLIKETEAIENSEAEKLHARLNRFKAAEIDRIFIQYLMWPRQADKHGLLARAGLETEDLKDLATLAKEFAEDCTDLQEKPDVRYFPGKKVRAKAGAPIKIENIKIVEEFADRFLENPTPSGYGLAKGKELNSRHVKLAVKARLLVQYRHGIEVEHHVEHRDGRAFGRKPKQKVK